MIGLDTNVLVRFLVQDDLEQTAAATALISGLTEAEPGYVCREVLVELVWVLDRAYGLGRADIARALDGLLEAQELVIEAADRVALAADRYRKGGGRLRRPNGCPCGAGSRLPRDRHLRPQGGGHSRNASSGRYV